MTGERFWSGVAVTLTLAIIGASVYAIVLGQFFLAFGGFFAALAPSLVCEAFFPAGSGDTP